jgi:uncharacterized protein (UPF0335 family)
MAKNEDPIQTPWDKAKAALDALPPTERKILDAESEAITRLDHERRCLKNAIGRVMAGADGKDEFDAATVVVLSRMRDERAAEYAKQRAELHLKFPFAKDLGIYW